MSRGRTRSELRQLLTAVLALEGRDWDVPVRVVGKACAAAGVSLGDVLWDVFQQPDAPHDVSAKKLCRAVARAGGLDAVRPLTRHDSAQVRMAAVHAYYNFGHRSDRAALEPLLADPDPG